MISLVTGFRRDSPDDMLRSARTGNVNCGRYCQVLLRTASSRLRSAPRADTIVGLTASERRSASASVIRSTVWPVSAAGAAITRTASHDNTSDLRTITLRSSLWAGATRLTVTRLAALFIPRRGGRVILFSLLGGED